VNLSMNDYDRCREILLELQECRMKWWGKYIDKFVVAYITLDLHERQDLANLTSPQLRFSFMDQVANHISKEFRTSSKDEKAEMLHSFYVLLIFENFDLDYRDSLLRVQGLSKVIDGYEYIAKFEWTKVSCLASNKVLKYMG
jgi:hypothetical protein